MLNAALPADEYTYDVTLPINSAAVTIRTLLGAANVPPSGIAGSQSLTAVVRVLGFRLIPVALSRIYTGPASRTAAQGGGFYLVDTTGIERAFCEPLDAVRLCSDSGSIVSAKLVLMCDKKAI